MEFISSACTKDSGLVIETKKEQEKFLKKGFSLLPREKKNVKLAGRMGIGAEKWRESRTIGVVPKKKPNILEEEIVGLFNEGVYDIPMNIKTNDENKNETQQFLEEPQDNKLSATNETKAGKITKSIKQRNQTKQPKEQITQSLTDSPITEKRKTVVSGRIIPEIIISEDDNDLKVWIIHNGPYSLNLYNLFSLELVVHKSLQHRLTAAAPSFVCGWLYDEIIDSYLFQLCLLHPSVLSCDSTLVQSIEKGKSIRNLWKNVNLKDVSMILVPINPTGNHWVLAALKPQVKTIILIDPMSEEINQSSSTFKTCSLISKRIFGEKFSIDNPVFALNTPHVKQSDLKSCGVLVCYYSLGLTNGKREVCIIFFVSYFSVNKLVL